MDFPAWPVDTVAEELIKGPADPSPATVQQDPFVGLADAQNVTCVRGTHPFDIPQQKHLALVIRQAREGLLHDAERLFPAECRLGVLESPRCGRFLPESHPSQPGLPFRRRVRSKTLRANRDIPLPCLSRGHGPSPAHQDAVDPGPNTGASLESSYSANYGKPRLLHDILGEHRRGGKGSRERE